MTGSLVQEDRGPDSRGSLPVVRKTLQISAVFDPVLLSFLARRDCNGLADVAIRHTVAATFFFRG